MIQTTSLAQLVTPNKKLNIPKLIQHFIGKIEIDNNGCWIWKGRTWGKYGRITINHDSSYASHRFSYEIFKGTIQKGLTIDHLCKTCHNINQQKYLKRKRGVDVP
jgi:hypothetical protein